MNRPNVGDDLDAYLNANASPDLARVLSAIARASLPLVHLIRRGRLAGALDAAVGPAHDGFGQKALDLFADQAFVNGLKGAGVRGVVSEEREDPVAIDADGTLLVAIDPLDGSSNIDANIAIGTFFSVLDAPAGELQAAISFSPASSNGLRASSSTGRMSPSSSRPAPASARRRSIRIRTHTGSRASGPDPGGFVRIRDQRLQLPPLAGAGARLCRGLRREGDEGPRGRNFNMRWVASTVADVYRILARGGVYLYPEDSRPGYEHGRLRLLYEANPVAFLVEQAGGAAIDGFHRILDVKPASIHVRTPLIFGSKDKVERIGLYYSEGSASQRAPLFGKRGLLRR